MSASTSPIRIGQFSESPVLAVARALGLHDKHDVHWETERVASSPAQFASVRDGELDLAITSPDNVMLYATTDRNPLSERLDVRMLRPVDRGLGLALYTDPSIADLGALSGSTLGVDVMNSGFALLLLRMLKDAGVDADSITFDAIGATPKRLGAVLDGRVAGTILNAETAVKAERAGLRRWMSSTDVSDDYLGTVLIQRGGSTTDDVSRFLTMWAEAVATILDSDPDILVEALSAVTPDLAEADYATLVQSSAYGCIRAETVSLEQLRVLADIRESVGAYRPTDAELLALLTT